VNWIAADILRIKGGFLAKHWKCVEYLMRNHTIAKRRFWYNQAVMLHAPLRMVIYAD
jgi:hypothetical protein